MSHHHFSGASKGAGAETTKGSGSSTLNANGWENSDFPVLCETCLGPNPYIRMTKNPYGQECKICARPFTIFRWKPGQDARYKKTEVCQTCAKLKNVCQTCLLDLQYNLPVQVRDQELAAAVKVEMPTSDAHKEWFAEQAERRITEGGADALPYGKAAPTDTLKRLQRTTPYYKRNRARICSFFVKGTCNRGDECPYRHEMPTVGPLSEQNVKDRYYGVNDPVANKMLQRVSKDREADMRPPADQSITSLYLAGVVPGITREDIRAAMPTKDEIASIRVIQSSNCAFIEFADRPSAERAARQLAGALLVKGERVRVMWGRSSSRASAPQHGSYQHYPPAPGGTGSNAMPLPPPSVVGQGLSRVGGVPPPPLMPGFHPVGGRGPPPPPPRPMYPSMDPTAMGSRPERK